MRITPLFLIFCWHAVLAQYQSSPNPVFPPAPNSAALGRYGEVPVSLYTGVPGIEIPLYTLDCGSISVPVSLSYHAGGNRVTDVASWVGLGWSLNAGGVITRTVHGLPDEYSNGYWSQYNTVVENGQKFYEQPALTQCVTAQIPMGSLYTEKVAKGQVDGQPDEFYFNFQGRTGAFYIIPDINNGGNLKVIQVPQTDLLIECTNDNTAFKVTDESGTVYHFSITESSYLSNINGGINGLSHGGYAVSSWMLTSIERDNRTVNFSYTDYVSGSYFPSVFQYHSPNINCPNQAVSQTAYTGTTVTGKSLYEISIPGMDYKVRFVKSTETRLDVNGDRLDRIEVYNKDEIIKRYQLFQSYFSGIDKRLRLDSLREVGMGESLPSTVFEYNTTLFPAYDSFEKDHWGFYNGTGSALPPYESNCLKLTGGSREPNSAKNQVGILEAIVYPTGGRTSFEYETNSYGYKNKIVNGTFEKHINYIYDNEDHTIHVYSNYIDDYIQEYTFVIDFEQNVSFTETINQCTKFNGGLTGAGEFRLYDSNWDQISLNNTATCGITLDPGTYHLVAELMLPNPPHGCTDEPNNLASYHVSVHYKTRTIGPCALAGGLRIKKITSLSDATSEPVVKVYDYSDEAHCSSGILYFTPNYVYNMEVNGCNYLVRHTQPQGYLGSTKGGVVGYQRVRVNYGASSQYGYEVSYFTAYPSFGGNHYPFPPPENDDFRRGLLSKMNTYNASGTIVRMY